jgi:hypothetical protein
LILDRLDDLGVSVPGVTAPKPGQAIKNFSAILSDVMHALALHHNARIFFEKTVVGEGHPQRVHVEFRTQLRRGNGTIHSRAPDVAAE